MTDKNTQNEEIVENPTPETEAQAELPKPSYEELEQMLSAAQAKAEENWNLALRAQAEADNVRRRAERDVESAHKYALERFVNELLPVKDSLEMGEAAARNDGADLARVREGLELTARMLASAIGKFGVVEVNPVGQKFSPEYHQAMSMQELPDAAPNTVVAVYQKGYLLNERLIRPAMVVVASASSGANLKAAAESAGTIDFQA